MEVNKTKSAHFFSLHIVATRVVVGVLCLDLGDINKSNLGIRMEPFYFHPLDLIQLSYKSKLGHKSHRRVAPGWLWCRGTAGHSWFTVGAGFLEPAWTVVGLE